MRSTDEVHPPRVGTVSELKALGISRRSVRYVSHHWGGRTLASTPLPTDEPYAGNPDDVARCLEISRVCPHAVISHLSAWQMHRLPVPSRTPRHLVYISLHAGDRRTVNRAGVECVRRHQPLDTMSVDGAVVTTPPQTWLDLCSLDSLTPDELIACAEAWVGNDASRLLHLRNMVDAARRVRGVRVARQVAPLVRLGSESFQESVARCRIVAAGLPEPAINVDIRTENGSFVARADMLWDQQRHIVEYDGSHHFASRDQHLHDLQRISRMEDVGYTVQRVTVRDLRDPAERWLARLHHRL